jgi:DNA topoisomerase-1
MEEELDTISRGEKFWRQSLAEMTKKYLEEFEKFKEKVKEHVRSLKQIELKKEEITDINNIENANSITNQNRQNQKFKIHNTTKKRRKSYKQQNQNQKNLKLNRGKGKTRT